MAVHNFIVTPVQQTQLTAASVNIDQSVQAFVISRLAYVQQLQVNAAYQLCLIENLPLTLLTKAPSAVAVNAPVTIGIHSFTLSNDQELVLAAVKVNIDLDVRNYVSNQVLITQLLTTRTTFSNALLTKISASEFAKSTPTFIIPS